MLAFSDLNPAPEPLNCVVAVIVVPERVVNTPVDALEAPIVVPLILPPVIATELAFWVLKVPNPDTCVLAIAIFCADNALNWPWALTVTTGTTYTYCDQLSENALGFRITDDGMGKLRMYYYSSTNVKVYLNTNLGTVNYVTGELTFAFTPYDYSNYINFYAKLLNDDIIVQQNSYIKIDYSKVNILIEVKMQ